MKYIVITEVDAETKIPCTQAPMKTGPSMPTIKGLSLEWTDQSTWPVELAENGSYLRASKYYATCDDDADLSLAGVLETITEQEWLSRKRDEFYARQPYASWIWDEGSMTWSSPVPYPEGADSTAHRWDESTVSWKEVEYNA